MLMIWCPKLFLHAFRIPNPLSFLCVFCFVLRTHTDLQSQRWFGSFVHLHTRARTRTLVFFLAFLQFIFAWKLLMTWISSIFSDMNFCVGERVAFGFSTRFEHFLLILHRLFLRWFHNAQHLKNVIHDMGPYFIFAQMTHSRHYNWISF